MHVLSAAEMQACDRATSEQFGISSLGLMRAASGAVALFAREQFPEAKRVVVLCGKGNNGGDGLMTARLLAESGLDLTVLLLGNANDIKGDAREAWQELATGATCTLYEIDTAESIQKLGDEARPQLILDAVVGTGFKPPLKGLAVAALDWVKASGVPVLAVDLPSGWAADSTDAGAEGPVFPADAVITFTAPKPAHVFGQLTRRWDQPVVAAPIGSPKEAIVSSLGIEWAGAAQALTLAPRSIDSNKGKFGHVLVVGGSFGSAGGKAGAPSMSSLAAMRAGAGLVTAAVPAPALSVVSSMAPELMTWPLKATESGQIAAENASKDQIESLVKGITVLAIGPGMGQSSETQKFLSALLAGTRIPAVIDADALNMLAQESVENPSLLSTLGRERTIVITPHPGEMARLVHATVPDVQANRLEVARKFALENHVTVVLKGARTLIAHPDGRVAVNTTGNPGMAKGGSGDLLTGVVAAMLAQYPNDTARAVEAAVFLHGLAADLAVRAGSEHTLLATDSLPHLSQAFRFHSRTSNGYVWLQGFPPQTSSARSSHEAAE